MSAVCEPQGSAALLAEDRYGLIGESDRRFRRLLLRFGLPMLLFAIAVPWLQIQRPAPPVLKVPEPVLRRVELLPEPPRAPAAAKPAAAAPKAEAMPVPKPDARQQAAAAGLMQLREQLAAMSDRSLVAVNQPQALITGTRSQSGSSPVLAAATSSGGAAGTAARGVAGQGSAGDLGARRTGQVQSSTLGTGSGSGSGTARGAGADGLGAAGRGGRGLEDIQLGFDRSKSSLNAIFSRAARETTGMGAGRIVVSLTIAPDGSVTRCELVSSSFSNPALEQKLLGRIRQMNFGAKDVPPFSYTNYPIDYLPT